MKQALVALCFLGCCFTQAAEDLSQSHNSLKVEVPRYRPVLRGFEKMDSLSYEAGWNGIPTTNMRLSLSKFDQAGESYYKVRVEISNKRVLGLVWDPRNSIEAVLLASTLEPKSYHARWEQRHKKIETTVTFNRIEKKVHSLRIDGGNKQEIDFSSDNTYDPLSATLVALSQDLKVGDNLQFDAFNGKERYKIGLMVEAEEEIQIGKKKLPALKVLPSIANLLNPTGSRNLSGTTVWVSNDGEPKILKIRSKAPLGYYYSEIVE